MKTYKIGSRVQLLQKPSKRGEIIEKDGQQGDLFISVKWDNGTTSQLHEIQVFHEGEMDTEKKGYKMSLENYTREKLLEIQKVISEEFHKHQNEVNFLKIEQVAGITFNLNTKRCMCELSMKIDDLLEEMEVSK